MTTSDGPSCGSGRRGRIAPLILTALLIAVWGGVSAQEEEDLGAALDQYRSVLALGRQALENLDLAEALGYFGEVIDAHRTGRLPTTTPLTRQMIGQAWEGRALAYANLGRMEEAEADFEALIRFDGAWPIDRERHSPKIVALFDKVRKRVIGTLAVDSTPPGAEIFLNGEAMGRTPMFDREMPAGPYALEVRLAGFEAFRDQVVIQGGAGVEREIALVPNARGILIATSPPGVTVTVDGTARGTTFGTAGPEYLEAAERTGVDLTRISAPLLVDNLPPGQHLLKLEKDCHVSQLLSVQVTLDPNGNAPQRYEPMVLSPSLGSISVTAVPVDADVYMDGNRVGRTPLRIPEVCSGRHALRVSVPEVGQWIGSVDVERDRREEIVADLRMTLLWLGIDTTGETPPEEAEFGARLERLRRFNVLAPQALPPAARADAVRIRGGGEVSESAVRALAAATDADLIARASIGGGEFETRLEITLQSTRYPALVDQVSISLDDEEDLAAFLDRLDRPSRLRRPWLGVEVIEIHRAANPVVIRVRPSSPAERAGVKVGDRIVSLAGKPVKVPADLDRLLGELEDGSGTSITIQGAGSPPRQVSLQVGVTPVIPPSKLPGHLRSVFAAEMSFIARLEAAAGRGTSPARNAALLNLGVALMRDGLCQPALREGLEVARLPEGPGVSAGTVSYLEGVCLERLNRPADARRRFEMAAGQAEATLWTHDGPPVAERAKRRLEELGSS